MHSAAVRAGAQGGVRVEPGIDRRQIINNADKIDLGAVHAALTLKTIPFHGVQRTLWAGRFDHQPD